MQQSGRNIQILGIKCADIVIVGFWTLLLAVLASLGAQWFIYGLHSCMQRMGASKWVTACLSTMVVVPIILLLCYVVRNILEHCPRPGMSHMAMDAGYSPLRLKELSGATVLGLIFGSVMAPTFRSNVKIAQPLSENNICNFVGMGGRFDPWGPWSLVHAGQEGIRYGVCAPWHSSI